MISENYLIMIKHLLFRFELLSLALLGVPSMLDSFQEITAKLTALKFDSADYVCLKFILLLNPGASTGDMAPQCNSHIMTLYGGMRHKCL